MSNRQANKDAKRNARREVERQHIPHSHLCPIFVRATMSPADCRVVAAQTGAVYEHQLREYHEKAQLRLPSMSDALISRIITAMDAQAPLSGRHSMREAV